MKTQKKNYSEEFKRDAVRLLRSRGAQKVTELAASIGVTSSMLYRWQSTHGAQAKESAANSESDREEVERMRRRLRELEQENSLLKKAAALFAREVK